MVLMDDRERAYTWILRQPLAVFTGACYEFYVYTADDPPFVLDHVTGSIDAMLDYVHAYVQEDVASEVENEPFFWEHIAPEVAQIIDPEWRAFAQYATGGCVAPIYTLDAAYYLQDILADKPGYHFVIGWEAQPPLHEVAYGILGRAGASPQLSVSVIRAAEKVQPGDGLDLPPQFNEIAITGNREGLRWLAAQLLKMADAAPDTHTHLDRGAHAPIYESADDWWLTLARKA